MLPGPAKVLLQLKGVAFRMRPRRGTVLEHLGRYQLLEVLAIQTYAHQTPRTRTTAVKGVADGFHVEKGSVDGNSGSPPGSAVSAPAVVSLGPEVIVSSNSAPRFITKTVNLCHTLSSKPLTIRL